MPLDPARPSADLSGMSKRRSWWIPVLVLAVLQSLGHAHCAWMSMSAACPMNVVSPVVTAVAAPATTPARAAGQGHDCCGHGATETSAASAAEPASAPSSEPAGGCDCPCMHQPIATPAAAIVLNGPGFERDLAFDVAPVAFADGALACALARIVPTADPPPAAPPPDPAAPRGPPALV
jgi:hypothetical protein